MLLFHRFGEFALALALGAVLAEDVAGEDFDFRDEVGRVGGVLEHCVDEVLFVAGDESAQVVAAAGLVVQLQGSATYLSLTSLAQAK